MAKSPDSSARRFMPSVSDDLHLIISLSREGIECAEGLAADFSGVEELAHQLLRKLEE